MSGTRPLLPLATLHFLLLAFLLVDTAGAQQPLSSADRGKLDGKLQLMLDQSAVEKDKTESTLNLPSFSEGVESSTGASTYSVVIHTNAPATVHRSGIDLGSVLDGFATARVTRDQLRKLAELDVVSRVSASTRMEPTNDEAAREVGARILNAGAVNNTNYTGQGVITCLIDTGIDYDHGDFYNSDGTTRILRIWDQPDDQDSTGTGHPNGYSYGAEYTRTEIDAGNVSARDFNGHGTHVAGTATSSGNELVLDGTQTEPEHRGMAPESDIVMVKTTFWSADIIDALTYCHQVGTNEDKPVVINMSLGSHDAPHDGTSSVAQTVDLVSGAGTIVVASAGNSGDQPIHTSGTVSAGDTTTATWDVGSYSPANGSSNDFFLTTFWIDGTNELELIVRSPDDEYADTLEATGFGSTTAFKDTTDGAIYIESGTSSDNSDRYFQVQVYDNRSGYEPAEGTWDISITNYGRSSTTYHAWTHSQTIPGSFGDANSEYTIANPGTAADAITVGSYVHRWRWANENDQDYAYDASSDNRDDISTFSSRGPLRDGSQKPEIAAPGQGMISALSLDMSSPASSSIVAGGKHRILRGTSMSAPVVTGSIALLLQQDASLTPSEAEQYIMENAIVDDFVTTYGATPNTRFGAGKLNILGAMTDLVGGTSRRQFLTYEDPWTTDSQDNQTVGGSGANEISLRFTPTESGYVTGALVNLGGSPAHNLSAPLNFEVWSNDGTGNPDAKIGNTAQVSSSQLKPFSPTAVNLIPASVDVSAGTDYHLVLYPSDGSEEIDISYETVGSASGRSLIYDGSSWSSLAGDFVIRPEIARTTGVAGTLPVEIAAFSGVTDGSAVTLTWSTASETNNTGFRLQHSSPETSSFARAAFVEGHGTTSSPHTYRHTLEDLSPGTHTFRLQQVDADGTVNPGPTTTVDVELRDEYDLSSVKPNPIRERATVSLTVREEQDVRAAVYNVLGQRVAMLHDGPLPAQDPTTLTFGSSLESGVYFLRIRGSTFSTTRKFVRVK